MLNHSQRRQVLGLRQYPDLRVYAGNVKIGAAWSATSKEGKAYLSVKLDDPSFAKPILRRLVQTDRLAGS